MSAITSPADLLATPHALTLDHVTLDMAGGTITVAGSADMLGRSDATLTYSFTARGDAQAISTTVAASQVPMAALIAGGWVAATAGMDNVILADLLLTYVADADAISLSGRLTQPVVLGAVTIDRIAGHIAVAGGATTPAVPSFEGVIGAAQQLVVRAVPPAPYAGWRVASLPGASVPIQDAAVLLGRLTGSTWGSLLPAMLPTGLALTAFSGEYSTDFQPLTSGGSIKASGDWTLIPQVLALKSMQLDFLVDSARASVTAVSGRISGIVALFGSEISATMPLSADTILLRSTPCLALPTIAELSSGLGKLLALPLSADVLPVPIRNFGGFVVEEVSVALVSGETGWTLDALGLKLGMPEPELQSDHDAGTPVDPPEIELLSGVQLVGFHAALDVRDPLGQTAVGLDIAVDTLIGDIALALRLTRQPGDAVWNLGLAAPGTLTLAALPRLLGWSGEIAPLLPTPLAGIAQFGLDAIDVSYDFDRGQVVSSLVQGSLDGSWAIVGNSLVLENFELTVTLDRTAPFPPAAPAQSTQQDGFDIGVSMRSQWKLGSALFAVDADRASDSGNWSLAIQMAAGSHIGLSDMLAAVAPQASTIPAFLPQIDITQLGLGIDLGSEALMFNLRTEAHWLPSIAGKVGSCMGFDLLLALGPAPAAGTSVAAGAEFGGRAYSVTFDATLAFEGLPTIEITASTTAQLDYVEVSGIVGGATGQADAAAWARSFAGADWSADSGGASALATPSLSAAVAYLRIPKDASVSGGLLVISGALANAGTAALVVARFPVPPATNPAPSTTDPAAPVQFDWGYAFLLEARPNFTFASLDARLGVIDQVITLTGVGVAIASFDASAPGTSDALGVSIGSALASAQADLADTDTPAAVPAASVVPVFERGLNVHGELVFQGALWEALSAVLDLRGAALALRARIDPIDAAATLFTGQLDDFTLLGLVHFDSLAVIYRPRAQAAEPASAGTPATLPVPSLSIDGRGAIRLGTTSLDFQGSFAFTTAADASGQSASDVAFHGTLLAKRDVENPLGIRYVALHPASISGRWSSTGGRWACTEFQLDASATICGLTLAAALDLSAGDRHRVLITLAATDQLSLQNLIVLGLGASWADGLVPDLTFSNGSLEYVRFTDPNQAASYSLSALGSILGFGFLFTLQLRDGDGVSGSAALNHQIGFGSLLRLSGRDGTGGPLARLSRNSAATTMTLETRVTVLDHDVDVSLAYVSAAGAATYIGTIATQIGLGALGSIHPTLVVTSSEDGKTDVSLKDFGLPVEQLKQAFDVVKEIAEFKGPSGECLPIGDVLGGAIDIGMSVGLAFPKLAPGSGPSTIRIDLDISCTIKLLAPINYDWPIKVELPFLDIAVPSNGLTFGNVISALLVALPGALPKLIASFFADPAAMAKLTALAAAKAALNAVTDALLCHSTPPGGGGGGGGGAADPRAAYVAAFAVATGVIAFLVSILDSLTDEQKERKERAKEKQRENAHALANFVKPDQLKLIYVGGNGITLTCHVDDQLIHENEGGTYIFTLARFGADGTADWRQSASVQWLKGAPAPTVTISDANIVAGRTYDAQVLADVRLVNLAMPADAHPSVTIVPFVDQQGLGLDGMFDVRAQSDTATGAGLTVQDLAAREIAIEEVGAQLAVSFQPGPVLAEHFQFRWTGADGAALAGVPDPILSYVPGQTLPPYHVRLDLPASVDRIGVRVVAFAAAAPDPVSQAATSPLLDLARLPAPVLEPSVFAPASATLQLAWSESPGATGYKIQGRASPPGPTDAPPVNLPLTARAGTLAAEPWIGTHIDLRVGAIGAGGKGVTWSLDQAFEVPGALVTIVVLSAPEGQSADALAVTVSGDLPSVAATVVAAGKTKPLGLAPSAAFTALRSGALTALTARLMRYRYALTTLQPALTLSVPPSGAWPQPAGTTLSTDWGLQAAGGTPIWVTGLAPIALQARVMDAIAAPDERNAVANAIDANNGGRAQRDAAITLSTDPEATSVLLAPQEPTEAVPALTAAYAALGQPIDPVLLARLLGRLQPAPTVTSMVDHILSDTGDDPLVLLAACRVAGADLRQSVVALHAARPEYSAAVLAKAALAAFFTDAGLRHYAELLVLARHGPAIIGARVARLAAIGSGSDSATDVTTIAAAVLASRGVDVRTAAVRLKQAAPTLTAGTLAAVLVTAYYRPPPTIGTVAAAVAITAALPQATSRQLGWALASGGLPADDLALLVAAAGAAPADPPIDLAAVFASAAAGSSVRAALTSAAGSSFAAIAAARLALAALSPDGQIAAIAAAFPGMAARPELIAAGLATIGTPTDAATAALARMLKLDTAAAAWTAGGLLRQSLA